MDNILHFKLILQSVCLKRTGAYWCSSFWFTGAHSLAVTEICVDCCADEGYSGSCACGPNEPLTSSNVQTKRDAWLKCCKYLELTLKDYNDESILM